MNITIARYNILKHNTSATSLRDFYTLTILFKIFYNIAALENKTHLVAAGSKKGWYFLLHIDAWFYFHEQSTKPYSI